MPMKHFWLQHLSTSVKSVRHTLFAPASPSEGKLRLRSKALAALSSDAESWIQDDTSFEDWRSLHVERLVAIELDIHSTLTLRNIIDRALAALFFESQCGDPWFTRRSSRQTAGPAHGPPSDIFMDVHIRTRNPTSVFDWKDLSIYIFNYFDIMQLGISEMREPGQIWKSKTFRQRKTSDLGDKFGSKCG